MKVIFAIFLIINLAVKALILLSFAITIILLLIVVNNYSFLTVLSIVISLSDMNLLIYYVLAPIIRAGNI